MSGSFDPRAAEWDLDPARLERARAVAEAIRRRVALPDPCRMLEYGCGTGLLSFALQPFPGPMTLADSSPGMLRELQAKIRASGFDNMTAEPLDLLVEPPPASRYDLICLLMVLHHIADVGRLLGALHTLLAHGGTLCLADLDREDGSFHGPGFSGHAGFDRAELGAWLELAGFGSVRLEQVWEVRRGERRYPLFLATAVRP